MEYQNTINKEFRLTGPGLHTGRTVTVTVKPAPENFGIAFRRTDRTNIITQQAIADNVGETSRGTTLGSGRHTIATIEHLMSALHGMKVDNALIELDGGEVPILDGSSRPWMLQLVRVGVRQQHAERHVCTIDEPLHFEFAPTGSVFDLTPSDRFSVRCEIDFANSVIGHQVAEMTDLSEYAASIAPCRTFVFLDELQFLIQNNLARGGDLDLERVRRAPRPHLHQPLDPDGPVPVEPLSHGLPGDADQVGGGPEAQPLLEELRRPSPLPFIVHCAATHE